MGCSKRLQPGVEVFTDWLQGPQLLLGFAQCRRHDWALFPKGVICQIPKGWPWGGAATSPPLLARV